MERLKTSDIAQAFKVNPRLIGEIARNEGIKGEREGVGRGKQTEFTIEQAEAIARVYRGEEGVKQLHDWINRPHPVKEKKEGEKKQAEKEKETTPQKALSESYGRMVKRLTEETDWWIDAVTKIGHTTVLVAFQEAKVPPESLYEEVRSLKNADEFVAKVDEYMAALYEAKNDARSLLEMEKEKKKLYYKLIYTIEIAKELARRLREMENMYNLAVSNLDEEGLRKLVVATPMVSGITLGEEEKG